MSSKIFKRTAIAASLLAVSQAHAALYRVVEAESPNASSVVTTTTSTETRGVAIEPSTYSADSLGCFDSGASCDTNTSKYKMAVQTLVNAYDGARYSEEVPFGMDNKFQYIQTLSDYKDYCTTELRYNDQYCDNWANIRFTNVWQLERNRTAASKAESGDTTESEGSINSQSYIEGETANYNTLKRSDSTNTTGYGNTIINKIYDDSGSLLGVGNTSTYADGLDYRNTAFSFSNSSLKISLDSVPQLTSSVVQSRAFARDGNYTAGSFSYAYFNANGNYYYSKPAFWASSGTAKVLDYGTDSGGTGVNDSSDALGSGSIRDFYIDDTRTGKTDKTYAVGYDTYSNQYMDATVFVGDSTDPLTASWDIYKVQDAQVDPDGSYTYSNSVMTGINRNLVAIGYAKRAGSKPYNNAANRIMFLVTGLSTASSSNLPTASFFSSQSGFTSMNHYFTGIGGTPNAINSYDEIVGQVGAENVGTIDGTPRRQRAFIYPYNGDGAYPARRSIFENKAWWLDDLTNGDNGSGQNYSTDNNAYRIINATGINDDGVISGTALKCSGGYSSTNDYASCSTVETTVAVKLIPIANATSADIDAREASYPKTERKGGSVGWLGLSILALLGLQRRRRT